ncbi:MAG: glycoside hydrolase domain-containing protein [Candidatus Desantisbacteria bacterium]
MKIIALFIACLTVSCSSPKIQGIKCPVVADNYICAYKTEQESNLGGKTYLRLKGIEDTAVLKFDTTHLKGMTVESATLYLHKKKHDLLRVGVSTIASDWVEGHGKGYAAKQEASCFQYAAYKKTPWSYPGSDFTDVIYGQGNSLFAYAQPELADGWYAIPIQPDIVHALIIGDQYGLAVTDEKGQIPVEKSVNSKESIFAPFLVVKAKKIDSLPPSPVSALTATAMDGKICLTWKPTGDDGIAGKAFGYSVRYSSLPIIWDSACPVKRWKIPRKPEPGKENIELMIDNLIPCQRYYFAVQAYDEAGNKAAIAYTDIVMPEKEQEMELLEVELPQPESVPFVPVFGNGAASIWAVGDLEKVNPVTANSLEDDKYTMPPVETANLSNPIWDASQKVINIYGARNETVAFQVVIQAMEKTLNNVVVQADSLAGNVGIIPAEKNIELFKLWYVPVEGVYYPDACVPLKGKFNIPETNNKVPEQKNQAVWVDIYIPKETPAGMYEGVLSISSDEIKKPVEIGINLTVWNFSLPDTPSFVNELNAYGGIHKGMGVKRGSQEYEKIELGYHQLTHKHRSTLNVLPYGHEGNISSSDYVPLVGADLRVCPIDWTDWDKRFGLYLDGSAFTEDYGYYGPGTGTPITHFYLPFNENWPAKMMDGYGVKIPETQYPACVYEHASRAPSIEKAFSKDYKESFVSMASEYAKHFREKGWDATRFQFYLNNKYYARENEKGAAWWLLDEPAHRDDFLALAFFGKLFWEGVKPYQGGACFDFRVDISRPQYQRGMLDGLASLQDVSSKAFFMKNRLCMERKQRFGEKYWFYGGGPQIEETSASLMGLYYQAYLLGADGGLPYYTSFCRPDCWSKGEYLAIVYPAIFGPVAGLRLKVERRAVQDIEYLTLLATKEGWSRAKVNQAILKKIRLKGEISSKDADDPGRITFSHLKPDDFNRLRIAIAKTMMVWE